MSEQSEQINDLAAALAKAQGEITGALKDSSNPFFKSKYADLAACWDACRGQLSKNGLAVIQTTERADAGVCVVTLLTHASGQWIRGRLHMTPKDTSPQGLGSAITYARRYALAGIVGLSQVDDDGNEASGKGKSDPRGEPAAVDEKEKAKYISLFTDALNADVEEDKKAETVWGLNKEISPNADLYIQVADALGSKSKTAIRSYVAAHNKAIKDGAVIL